MARPERTISQGDIIIFPANSPLSSSDASTLVWHAWRGSDWQSHIDQYFPDIESTGYLTEKTCLGWRAMIPQEILDSIQDIPNVKNVHVYRSLPCLIVTKEGQFPAVLRGFEQGPEFPLDAYITDGTHFSETATQHKEALVPLAADNFPYLRIGDTFQIVLPEPTLAEFISASGIGALNMGINWKNVAQYSLSVQGGYKIQTGEEIDYETWNQIESPEPPTIPIFWNRPEVLIPMDLFENIMREIDSNVDDHYLVEFGTMFPSYQITVTVDTVAEVKKTTSLIRNALGSDYGVYAIPEVIYTVSSKGHVVMPPDLHKLFSVLLIVFSSIVVAGNIYIITVQQRRKIGLFRVVGATSKDIRQYVLTMCGYISIVGTCSGAIFGDLIYLVSLLGSDIPIKSWFIQVLTDFGIITGLSLALSLGIGFAVAYWASKLPCSEVLRRE